MVTSSRPSADRIRHRAAPKRQAFNALIGARLRSFRASQGVSQTTLAARSALNSTTIASIERGIAGVQLETIYLLCAGLGIEPGQLLPSVEEVRAVGLIPPPA